MATEKELDAEFRRGYYLAVANLMRTHGQDTMAADVLRAYGPIDFTGIDPVDISILRPVAKQHGLM